MTKYFTKDGDDYAEVKDDLHTQEDLDRIVKDRAERIARSKFSDYDDLKEQAGKVQTVTEEYEDKIKSKDEEVKTLQTDLKKSGLETSKVKLIHEFKLSDELAEFVDGEDEDAMRERAEKLSKGVGGKGVPIKKDKKPEGEASTSKEIAGKIFGGKKSDD